MNAVWVQNFEPIQIFNESEKNIVSNTTCPHNKIKPNKTIVFF